MVSLTRTHRACLESAFGHLIPPPEPMTVILISVIRELNMTPTALNDEQQARALQRILSRRGLSITGVNPHA